MKQLLITGILFCMSFGDPYTWSDDVFPPDPERSVEELKMKPMVARKEVIVGSGSQNVVSTDLQNRGRVDIDKGSDLLEWQRKIDAAKKNKAK